MCVLRQRRDRHVYRRRFVLLPLLCLLLLLASEFDSGGCQRGGDTDSWRARQKKEISDDEKQEIQNHAVREIQSGTETAPKHKKNRGER